MFRQHLTFATSANNFQLLVLSITSSCLIDFQRVRIKAKCAKSGRGGLVYLRL